MKAFRQIACVLLGVGLGLGLGVPALAWDSVGHRLSAAVAVNFLDQQTTAQLLRLLTEHPRFEEDFLAAIPSFIDRDDPQALTQWLLGQAAYWPDIARGLPEAEQRRFNRPAWHYIDGAWVRGGASLQGNVYVGMAPFAAVQGPAAARIDRQAEADNVVTALDYNTRILADPNQPAADRAVALCWVLHLMGDIHQPLHTGSLFSPELFAGGDRGGNAISVGNSNLHAVWDRALRAEGVTGNLAPILALAESASTPRNPGPASDWTDWMRESRELLHSFVYTDTVLAAVRRAEASGRALPSLELGQTYTEQMQRLARQRIGLAGLRLANWLENELP